MWQSSWICLWKLRHARKLSEFRVKISIFWNVAAFIKIHCYSVTFQKQPPKVFFKIVVLKYFAKSTGKHLCQSFLFYKVTGFLFKKKPWRTPFLRVTASDFLQYDEVFSISCFYRSSKWLFKVKITCKIASFIKK